MQNAAVAGMFEEIADYLELAGENTFKIRAYRKAAEAILSLEEPIESLADGDALEGLQGLGPATIAKTREFLATGSVRLLDKLRGQYPPGLLDVMKVPGLGPKKVGVLFKERGVDSLEKLVEILESGGLEGLSGFGGKTIEALRTGIRRLGETSAKLPLSSALGLANKLAAALEGEGRQIAVAGSVRRGVDTVSNINIVAGTDNAEAVLDTLAGLPAVLAVVEREPARAVVKVHPGLPVEVVCTSPEAFGSVLFQRTGSIAHLEVVRAAFPAARLDSWPTEAALFQSLGLPFIEPELREGKGEVEAASAGALPPLISVGDIRGELHAHSTWSDGIATIRQMAEAAQARGYSYVAITDHSKALAMVNGLDAARLRQQAVEIAQVQEEFPDLKLLRGIECDILRDGTLDLDDEILHELDLVVASVHSAFNLPEAQQTERMVRAISHPAVDIVAHPTGRVLGVRPPYEVNVPALIEAARAHGKALEINSSERLDLSDHHAYAAREAGVPLAIDTDAHSPRMLANIEYGILTARRAWCRPQDVLNTWPVEELLKWLRHDGTASTQKCPGQGRGIFVE